jgi:CPA2 family monovalent cation:H+ antiporter-2
MGHLPSLITDLALILITAAVVTLIFKKIKQPLVLGYVIAGFLVGPYSSIFPSIADSVNVKTLAEIGVIFLLFSLGLEFSFKKLMRVGGSATITAGVEIAFITVSGFLAGKLLGWSMMDCLFLGGMLASSSTTIIIRAFDELGIKTKAFARVVFGVLVVEDIVVILLMVMLSTIAVTQQVEGSELIFTVLKLGFFLILWFILGIFIIPTFLKKVRKLMNNEAYLILSTGLCLCMVVLATQVGFSAELGAFIMGSILAETTEAEHIEHIFEPVKNLFGTIFFVSVGMMINPATLVEYGWIVLIVTLLTILGKFFSTTFGAILSGQTLKQSVNVGMSMAQIGEFAFIVATLGMSLGVISDFLFPVAVAASAITTFTTPYMIKYSDNVYVLISKILPAKVIERIDLYSASTQTIQAESEWKKFRKKYLTNIFVNGFITFTLMMLGVRFLLPFLTTVLPDAGGLYARIITISVILAVSLPFLWALMIRRPDYITSSELWAYAEYNHGPLMVMEIVRILIGAILIGYAFDSTFSAMIAALVAIPLVFIFIRLFSRNIQKLYKRIEDQFVKNLNSRENAESEKNKPLSNVRETLDLSTSGLSTWDAYLADLAVPHDAGYAGTKIKDLQWRERYGINIVFIKRDEDDKIIYSPGPNVCILANDHLGVFSSESNIETFKPVLNAASPANVYQDIDAEDIVVDRIVIDEAHPLNGAAIKNSGIRENYNAIVVGIERGEEKILTPKSGEIFRINDIVWLVGERKKLKKLKQAK